MPNIKEALEELLILWEEATGERAKSNSIKMGDEASWVIYEASRALEEDETGVLASLKYHQAFKKLIQNRLISIEDLLKGDWENNHKDKFTSLQKCLNSGVLGDIYKAFVSGIIKNSKKLGKEYTEETILSIEGVEDIFVKAVKNFNNQYELKQERFTQGKLTPQEATIIKKLFRFESFEMFVDSLKKSKDDNFICVALCDRTFNEILDEDYDNRYDSSFTIGLKNNGVVITISDKTTWDSPEHIYKTRNPSRDFCNKVNYSYLPYFKLEDIENQTTHIDQLLLVGDTEIIQDENIVNLFDDTAIIYITTLLSLVYKKYFVDMPSEELEVKYFGKEIKLLPSSTSTEIIVRDNSLELPSLPCDITYDTYKGYGEKDKNIYNYGIFDWLLDIYPLPESNITLPSTFIGSERDAQKNLWWRIRKAQYNHIKKCLNEGIRKRKDFIYNWFEEQTLKNIESLVNYILDTPFYDEFNDYLDADSNKSGKPKIWEIYKDRKELPLSSLAETGFSPWGEKRYKFDIPRWDSDNNININTILGKIKGYQSNGVTQLWFFNDNDNRYYEITLYLRSYTDLEKFFKLDKLPQDLERYLNTYASPYTSWSWKPYTGNSILNFVDPLNDIEIPYDDCRCKIVLNISKSMYNKILKRQKEIS